MPFTLSHQLNPSLREYRRASSAAIDASLKPLMTDVHRRPASSGCARPASRAACSMVTSAGAALDAAESRAAPIHSLNSGPSMAPVAGRYFADLDAARDDRRSSPTPAARATTSAWCATAASRGRARPGSGAPFLGHMTGFPSVDVKSVGAGGGSIAWVDAGGLLHVGPQSAGAEPGPACYGRGGDASRP